jgi:hypothetical protein
MLTSILPRHFINSKQVFKTVSNSRKIAEINGETIDPDISHKEITLIPSNFA